MRGIEYSGTLRVSDRIRQLTSKGIEVINFGGGGSLDNTPRAVKEATKRAIDEGYGANLTEVAGIFELRESIARKIVAEGGLWYDPRTQIMVTVGAKTAIVMAMEAMVDPGDEVIILDPYWTSYKPMVDLARGVPKIVPLRKNGKFTVDVDAIRNAVTPRTRMLILNSPSNPIGRVFSRQELEEISAVAIKHDLIVLSDECYKELTYEGNVHFSIASFPGMGDRTIVIYSFGKAYTMFGWRVGYAAGNEQIIKTMLTIQSNLVSCPTTFAQKGALAALEESQPDLEQTVKYYKKLRDITVSRLSAIKGISCAIPEFGYCAFPDVSGLAESADALAEYLLEKWHVAVTPGSVFGNAGKAHLRISYRHGEPYLEKGLNLLEEALESYRKDKKE